MPHLKPLIFFFLAWSFFNIGCSDKRPGKPRVLVFTKTAGFHHSSIPAGVDLIEKLGKEKGFDVDTTSSSEIFNEDSLQNYSSVIFVNTTGELMTPEQQADFERYIQAGGGYVGIHAAADAEYDWKWYGDLVGGYFKSHPAIQTAKLNVYKDKKFKVTDSLPAVWERKDEWYNFRKTPSDVNVLVSIDESSYTGGENGKNHPLVWYHDYDGGRSFYLGMGHTDESYQDPRFSELLWEGIEYAIGENNKLDYKKAVSLRKPDDDRFIKTKLAGGLDEPTQLTILPDLDVLISERKGDIKYFRMKDSSIRTVAHLPVYSKALKVKGVNVETGLLGIHAAPDFEKSHWVYVYYSPVDTSVDRLSRFKFENEKFDLESEQTIIEVHTDREICCHTGGSIAFDSSNNLYLSVGDNTTPFNEVNPATGKAFPINLHSFAPLDDRPGFSHYDDRRAAGNSNDLRGKILRIHVNEDGSYGIPDGNLFPAGTPETRPEIYVMGGRNLYRISVDQHNGFLYWGDVGPDARDDSLDTRGPKGYDEINQAQKAGNFGWPYFVGNNYPYREYDFSTGKSGPAFDPQNVINDSRNNTGIRKLPDAQPAFIWYPYGESTDFPILGSGGRTAMAGPIYYVNDYPKETRFPDYYDGKLFIYDWIRDWIMAVTLGKNGELRKIEPFMRNTDFHHVIDLKAGKDGKFYMVEYGSGWFEKNPEAALSVVSYNSGNRPPTAELNASNTSGSVPLTVHFDAGGSKDPDGDSLEYNWTIQNVGEFKTKTPSFEHTFKDPGMYQASLKVSDGKGGSESSRNIEIYAGNNRPSVDIQITGGNRMFYFPNAPVSYEVSVNDPEDGSTAAGKINPGKVKVALEYAGRNLDRYSDNFIVNKNVSQINEGEALIYSLKLDCYACHKVSGTSVGPSYERVSERYQHTEPVIETLVNKIIDGGSGNWGEQAMSAHPKLQKEDAQKIVQWIFSLSDKGSSKSLPLKGRFKPADKFKLNGEDAIVLSGYYTDAGDNGVPSLTGSAELTLSNPVLKSKLATVSEGVSGMNVNGTDVKIVGGSHQWIRFSQISLTGVKNILVSYAIVTEVNSDIAVSLKVDGAEGKVIGQNTIKQGTIGKDESGNRKILQLGIPVTLPDDGSKLHDLYICFDGIKNGEGSSIAVVNVRLEAGNE